MVPDRSTLTGTNRPDPELRPTPFGESTATQLNKKRFGDYRPKNLYETNPGFIKIRPKGFNTDETVIITVVWHRLVTTVANRWNGGFFVKKRFPFTVFIQSVFSSMGNFGSVSTMEYSRVFWEA